MSDLPQTRSKRPISPSAPSSAWNAATSTVRKTSRPNHNISSTVRDAIPHLTTQQLRDMVQQLVNFHPSSREKIAELLPSFQPSQSPTDKKSTEAKYFEDHVDWCVGMFAEDAWNNHSTMSSLESCGIIARVLEFELERIHDDVYEFESDGFGCNEAEYRVDAAIALLDIGLLLSERTNRLSRPNHPHVACSCCCCFEVWDNLSCCDAARKCKVIALFENLFHTFRLVGPFKRRSQRYGEDDESIALEDERAESVIREWISAVVYATLDGSPHALRSVISKYVELPPMLPHLAPNDQPDNHVPQWLCAALRSIDQIFSEKKMPEKKIEEVPDVAGMSI